MATESGRASDPLRQRLAEEPRASEFVQAAILERRLAPRSDDALGLSCAIDRDTAYPTAEVERDPAGKLRLTCLGLSGPTGPLPTVYGELVRDEERRGNGALSGFLELFERRLVALLVQAHLSSRFWLRYAWALAEPREPDEAPADGPLESVLFALAGLPDPASRARAGFSADALLFHAGLLAQRPLSAAALCAILEDYFEVPVEVVLFTGKWIESPGECVNALGRAQSELSGSLCLGSRFFDPALGFRLALGPMRLGELQDFLPGRPAAVALERFLAYSVGPDQAFEYELTLQASDVPLPRLLGAGEGAQRLGWTTWLRSTDEPRAACSGPYRPLGDEPPACAEPSVEEPSWK